MSLHIEFCLDEIDCEIKAALDKALDDVDRISLQRHVDGMRAIIAFARIRSSTHQKSSNVADDDLTLVKGIGSAERRILNGVGVRSFAAIANWRRDDIKALAQHGITLERIACENWIEQAAILASGAKTHYVSSAHAGSAGLLDPGPEDDTVLTVDDQTEASSQIGTERDAEASGSEQSCGADSTPATEVLETQVTGSAEHRPNPPVTAGPLPTAAVIPFETAMKSRRPASGRPVRRVAAVATAVILTVLGVGLVAHQQLDGLPAIVVSDVQASTK